jgi:hypothetical protein
MRAREVIGLILALGIIGCTAEPTPTPTVVPPSSATPTPTPTPTPSPTPTTGVLKIECADAGCETDAMEALKVSDQAEVVISQLWADPGSFDKNSAWQLCWGTFGLDEEAGTDLISSCYVMWLDNASKAKYHVEGEAVFGKTWIKQAPQGDLRRRYKITRCVDQSKVHRVDNTTGETVPYEEGHVNYLAQEDIVAYDNERSVWKLTITNDSTDPTYEKECKQ